MKKIATVLALLLHFSFPARAFVLDSLEALLPKARQYGNYKELKRLYDQFSTYYESTEDYRNAYKYLVLSSELNDSLHKKEKENLILSSTISLSQKRDHKLIFVLLFLSMIICVALLFGRMKAKKIETRSKALLLEKEVLSRSVIEQEQKERLRIAHELNEGLGQQLSAAKLNISAFQSFFNTKNETVHPMLKSAEELLDDSVKQLRSVSHSVVPHRLLKSGLVSATREFIEKINVSSKVEVSLEVVGEIQRTNQTHEAVLFRSLQALIQNVLHHANATELTVQLINHEKELSIVVIDNGSGFDVKEVFNNATCLGLKTIQSWIFFLNGKVFFDSCPAKGTTVIIEIPN